MSRVTRHELSPSSGGSAILAIVGPTGSGKTDLAIDVARRFDAEIVGADSRQVYRQLGIGSAKPTAEQVAAVRHHLVDIVDVDQPFDCARFRALAMEAIADIASRGKRVLVVGGTGLYVKVLLRGLFDGPRRDSELRARLEALEDAEPGSLHRHLQAVDSVSAARLHPHDRIRLIRALEVYKLTGRSLSAWQAEHAFAEAPFPSRTLALDLPRRELYGRIDRRCREMIAAGLVDEVRALMSRYDPELPALQSPGYREIVAHLRGACDLETAIGDMARATRRLAKRQLTWFRGDRAVEWVPADTAALLREAAAWWREA